MRKYQDTSAQWVQRQTGCPPQYSDSGGYTSDQPQPTRAPIAADTERASDRDQVNFRNLFSEENGFLDYSKYITPP